MTAYSQTDKVELNNSAQHQADSLQVNHETNNSRYRVRDFSKKLTGYSVFMNSQVVEIRDNATGKTHSYSAKETESYRNIIEEIRAGKKVEEFRKE